MGYAVDYKPVQAVLK